MWFGVIGTAVWIAMGALIVFFRSDDIRALQLNTIGDTLSGFVAPLAFLWLIVATWLQRQELSLQRNELEETRKVLSEQQKQLENAARESANQTMLMRQTLQTSYDQRAFDEHKLRMYYLARFITTVARSQSLLIRDSNGGSITPGLYTIDSPPELTEDIVSVDSLLVDFATRQHLLQQTVIASQTIPDENARQRNEEVRSSAQYILKEAQILGETEPYVSNPLVAARLKGIEFEWFLANLKATVNVLFARPL